MNISKAQHKSIGYLTTDISLTIISASITALPLTTTTEVTPSRGA